MNIQKLLNYALVFLLAFVVVQWLFPREEIKTKLEDVAITMQDQFTVGKAVTLKLKNNTLAELTLVSDCPAEPFIVKFYDNGVWQAVTALATSDRCDIAPLTLAPTATTTISYQPWQKTLFVQPGKYRVEVPVAIKGQAKLFPHEFTIAKPGTFGLVWEEVIYRPIYNALIFLTTVAGHSFGWGVVLLTALIRTVLFFPFHRSMVSQRKMQKIQPEIDALKKKYAENQQLLAKETMELFKKHSVNPLGSCLPILIQMPFLFALFWIVQGGLGENNLVLLYSNLADFSPATITTHFFGLDLTRPDPLFIFPVVVGLLQFVQMRLAFSNAQKKQIAPPTDGQNPMAEAMQMTSKYMQYFIPVMVAFGGATMPVAVGLYWGTSTVFGIGQQLIVNKLVK